MFSYAAGETRRGICYEDRMPPEHVEALHAADRNAGASAGTNDDEATPVSLLEVDESTKAHAAGRGTAAARVGDSLEEHLAAAGADEVSTLRLKAPGGFSGNLVLGSPKYQSYKIGVGADGKFAIAQDQNPYLVIDGQTMQAKTRVLGAANLGVAAGSSFIVGTMPQWSLVSSDTFSKITQEDMHTEPKKEFLTRNWKECASCKPLTATQCAGVSMLGGYQSVSSGTMTKTFRNLPAHTRVRIVATLHAIDRWAGETIYAKASIGADDAEEYIFTKSIDSSNPTGTAKPFSICGDPDFGEPNFSNEMDVSLRHSGPDLLVTFGSTLSYEAGPGSQAYFGVSQVNLYLK